MTGELMIRGDYGGGGGVFVLPATEWGDGDDVAIESHYQPLPITERIMVVVMQRFKGFYCIISFVV